MTRAKLNYHCDSCNEPIKAGELYRPDANFEVPVIYSRACLMCAE